MIRAVFLALLPALLAAQQPGAGEPASRPAGPQRPGFQRGAARDQPPQFNPEEACTVSGQVSNASTGEPLGRATVSLNRIGAFGPGGGPRAYTATTDASGAFVITGVAPGGYRLSARRTGFVNASYGSRQYLNPGAVLNLGAKGRLSDLRLSMTPHAVLTGRITDGEGEPLEYVQVQAMRYRYSAAGKQWAPYGRAVTNDIGEYRVAGLPPGRYYIAASARRSGDPWMQASGPQPDEGFVPTYFPGTADPSAAAPVSVGPGEESNRLDLRLARGRTVAVRGRVSPVPDPSGRQRLMVLLRAGGLAASQMNRPAPVAPNGDFEFRGVAPGSYTLIAMVPERSGGLAARLPLEVGDAPVENLSVVMTPPLHVAGTVRAGDQAPAAGANLTIALRPREPFGVGAPPAATAQAGGAFNFPSVAPDYYDVALTGLPGGFYVKSVTAGGRDVLLAGLDLTRGLPGPIDIGLGSNAGQATGVVQNNRQEPVPGATVVLVPQEEERKSVSHYYHTATADDTGAFTFDNLAPGKYKVYGWTEIEPGAYYDPDFMRPFENAGESLTVREGGREDLKVRLTG